MYTQLPAPEYAPPVASPARAAPRFKALFLFWLLAAFGSGTYWALRHGAPQSGAQAHALPAVTPPLAPDFGKHLARAAADANLAEAGIRRSEEQLRHALALTDNPTEARHLHGALVDLEAAHQRILADRDELDSLNLLTKGTTQ